MSNMLNILAMFLILPFFLISTCIAGFDEPTLYDYGFDATLHIQKRQLVQSFIVNPIPLVDGKVQLRQEIRDLENDKDMWNLYILAVSWMQYETQDSPFSYYQIAGIHGAPGGTWGGVDGVPSPDNDTHGYCQHYSILFPTWHRPYMSLYEQVLYNIVQAIASFYPREERDRFQKAAKAFRIPYWDWALVPENGKSVLPLSVGGSPNVEVYGPNGLQLISNPLFSYSFKPLNASMYGNDLFFIHWNETKRAPTPPLSPEAISNNSAVAHGLDSHLPVLQQRLYNLFANYNNYSYFSNELWIPQDNKNSSYDSIESLHDQVHTLGGGGLGHLAIIKYSAFDPLFFLHHANVDRIFAMWQVIYDNTYVVPTRAPETTHNYAENQILDVNTPLTPFYVNTTSFWTSDMVRDHEVFGYTYADVANKNRSQVIANVNRLYTVYSPASMFTSQRPDLSSRQEKPADYHIYGAGSEPYDPKIKGLAWNQRSSHRPALSSLFSSDDKYNEWIANIRVNKQAMNSPLSIYLFLGAAPDDSSSWQLAPNLVGTFGVFANLGRGSATHNPPIAGTIPLTSALVQMVTLGQLASLQADDVRPFLESELTLRVCLLDGTVVEPGEVQGLGVSIMSSQVTAPTSDDMLASWGDVESHFDLFA
ncbi:hypothetical protein F4778DRAFT_207554 [Xylariomycetidae sp. FL2044]|nr:hypothetical protein F4778DRAFT_207554 [Xylariomycetidae sp. FL2044]